MPCPVPHRFLEFCKENGGYTGCPFPAKLDLQQGQDLLQGLSKLSPSTSGMDRPWWARHVNGGKKRSEKLNISLFFLGPRRHQNLPQDGEGGLPLQVEPEWRNEL